MVADKSEKKVDKETNGLLEFAFGMVSIFYY